MNKKILYYAVGLLSFTDVANSAVYQCKPCPVGTYSDGTKLSCLECPEGFVCPAGTGTPIPIENCKQTMVKNFTGGSTKDVLLSGIYVVEVAGGGGGGGGSYGGGAPCKYRNGANGGRGDKKTSVFYLSEDSTEFTYAVGAAGGGGPDRRDGYRGGTSSFTITTSYNTISLSAEGGYGGGAGTSSRDGYAGGNAGNGQGGCGGAGRGKTKCKSNPGYAGCSGWIKVYQLYDCKL
ncbi:hypothetical protein HDR59_00375 [bacterium]|nr:hypothetical protein [bacterium]